MKAEQEDEEQWTNNEELRTQNIEYLGQILYVLFVLSVLYVIQVFYVKQNAILNKCNPNRNSES